MTDFCVKISYKHPSARGTLMIIDQVTVSNCTYAADFTSDENFDHMLLSNVTINVSEIPNSDTMEGNIKSQKTKQVDSETLTKRWNIDLGNSNNTVN